MSSDANIIHKFYNILKAYAFETGMLSLWLNQNIKKLIDGQTQIKLLQISWQSWISWNPGKWSKFNVLLIHWCYVLCCRMRFKIETSDQPYLPECYRNAWLVSIDSNNGKDAHDANGKDIDVIRFDWLLPFQYIPRCAQHFIHTNILFFSRGNRQALQI